MPARLVIFAPQSRRQLGAAFAPLEKLPVTADQSAPRDCALDRVGICERPYQRADQSAPGYEGATFFKRQPLADRRHHPTTNRGKLVTAADVRSALTSVHRYSAASACTTRALAGL
jgi:hypothetical protein